MDTMLFNNVMLMIQVLLTFAILIATIVMSNNQQTLAE
jgi:hypothetical protein